MDAGLDKIDAAYRLTSVIAEYDRDEALLYLDEAQKLKRDPQLDCGRAVYVSSLRLAIRAFSALLPARLDDEKDIWNIASAIDRIPSLISRARLWTEVALRHFRARRSDDAKKIVRSHLEPLLTILEREDHSLWKRAVTSSSPALFQAHPTSTLELLNRLPSKWRDVSLDLIIEFIFQRVPPNEPFENAEGQCDIDWPSALDVCGLLSLADNDALISWNIETLVQSAMWKHNATPLTQEQRQDLGLRLTTLVAAKLPNARFITHNGFAIIASAQVARLRRSKKNVWEELILQGRAIPNVSDRVFVLGFLVSCF